MTHPDVPTGQPGQNAALVRSRTLAGRVNLLSEPMPGYHTATVMLRVEGGVSSEPQDALGLAYVLEQAIDKGTENYDGRQLADAFDAIGARHAVYTGRQSWVLVASALPEHLPRTIELLGEVVCHPVFPDEVVQTIVSLTEQELTSLEDSPRGLLRRQMALQAYGPVLGRHMLGSTETLSAISPARVREHWQRGRGKSGLAVTVAGAYDQDAVEAALEGWISTLPEQGFAEARPAANGFSAEVGHIAKPELEQTQIGISFPGVPYADHEQAVEKVLLGVLSGGMSSRLFTEVREKQGLVYWVGAWAEQPRGLGMVHIGAATKPERAKKTYDTLLREVARLEEDLTEAELERAKIGLIADSATSGASVQQRANDLLIDQFHLGHAVSAEQHREAIRAVTLDDIRAYLRNHPREALSIVTVGPAPLDAESEEVSS
jgi:predicted Zn-dependent peptidase